MECGHLPRQGNFEEKVLPVIKSYKLKFCLLILQPASKSGEVVLNVDVNANEYQFLKTTRIDDLPILPFSGYLVRFYIRIRIFVLKDTNTKIRKMNFIYRL